MNLYSKLQKRAAEGKPVRVGLIGAGKFGSMYLAQIPRTPGVHLVGIADLSPDTARAKAVSTHGDTLRVTQLVHNFSNQDLKAQPDIFRLVFRGPSILEGMAEFTITDSGGQVIFREMLTFMMEDPRNITAATHLLFIAKNMERIGDHATNIAERVHFAVLGTALTEDRPKADISSSAVVNPPA